MTVDRLRALEDRVEITELFHAYAFHFDRNEPESVVALFTDDATVDYGPEVAPIAGRAALLAQVTTGLRDIFAATSHHITNVSIHLDGDTANAVAYVYAWHHTRDDAPDGYLWGQYHTEVRRTDDGWRFTSLRLLAAGTVDFHRSTMHPIGRRP